MHRTVQRQRKHHGFTLVEILIVVVILGILAAIVVPQFSSAAETTRENSVKMDLNRMRIQIEIYRVQHNDTLPPAATFENAMTLASDVSGTTAAVNTPGYDFGPYVQRIPVHPFTGTATVGNGAVGSSAWYYNETTGEFRTNHDATARAAW